MDAQRWAAPSPLPGPVLTERLEIRRYKTGDGPALFEAVDRDRKALLPWLPWAAFAHRTEADTFAFLRDCRRGYASIDAPDFAMGVFRRSDGELVGGTGLHAPVPQARQAEIGYWLAPDERAQGLCSEATAGLISAAFTPVGDGGWELRRIVIRCAALNVRSVRVCERLGLRREAVHIADRWFEGSENIPAGYIDSHTYAVLDHEWNIDTHQHQP
ncbi:MAG: GNAT family N-acetyltransferase [Nannocystaceae bacterium]|nr:GNAT family N-acetyltransferase [Nannocystaceae bacterium]